MTQICPICGSKNKVGQTTWKACCLLSFSFKEGQPMETQDAKRLYSEVMREAQLASRAQGFKTICKGAPQRAARKIYEGELEKNHTSLVYEDWWSGVRKAAGMGGGNRLQPEDYKAKYIALVNKRDMIPSDDYLTDEWGAAYGTISSIRSQLKRDGYQFERIEGGWRVVSRPAPKPVVMVAPSTPTNGNYMSPSVDNAVPVLASAVPLVSVVKDDNSAVMERLDDKVTRIVELLEQLLKVWSA